MTTTTTTTTAADAPAIGNLPGADLDVTFASGATRRVNMIRLLTQTLNAESMARNGRFLPGLAKMHPTIGDLREEYELDWFFDGPVLTWTDAALVMRHFHGLCRDTILSNS